MFNISTYTKTMISLKQHAEDEVNEFDECFKSLMNDLQCDELTKSDIEGYEKYPDFKIDNIKFPGLNEYKKWYDFYCAYQLFTSMFNCDIIVNGVSLKRYFEKKDRFIKITEYMYNSGLLYYDSSKYHRKYMHKISIFKCIIDDKPIPLELTWDMECLIIELCIAFDRPVSYFEKLPFVDNDITLNDNTMLYALYANELLDTSSITIWNDYHRYIERFSYLVKEYNSINENFIKNYFEHKKSHITPLKNVTYKQIELHIVSSSNNYLMQPYINSFYDIDVVKAYYEYIIQSKETITNIEGNLNTQNINTENISTKNMSTENMYTIKINPKIIQIFCFLVVILLFCSIGVENAFINELQSCVKNTMCSININSTLDYNKINNINYMLNAVNTNNISLVFKLIGIIIAFMIAKDTIISL